MYQFDGSSDDSDEFDFGDAAVGEPNLPRVQSGDFLLVVHHCVLFPFMFYGSMRPSDLRESCFS